MVTKDIDAEVLAMMINSGVPMGEINAIPPSWNLQDLITGKVAAQTVYLTNEPFVIQEMGYEPTLIKPIDHGIDFYGDCLVTTNDMIRKSPEKIAAFLDAVRRGWRYAMEHQVELANLIHSKYSQDKSLKQLIFEARAMNELIQPNLVDIGYMNPVRWQFIADTYVTMGLMEPGYDLHDFLYSQIIEQLEAKKNRLHRILLGGLSLLVILGLIGGCLLLIFTSRLQREVRTRTRELSASEQKFRSFFELASVGVAQLDVEHGRFLQINKKFCAITGFSKAEMLQRTFRDITYEEDRAIDDELRRDLFAGKVREYTIEKRYVHKDGTLVWVIVSVSALWHDNEKPEATLAVIRDISLRKKAEEELIFAAKVFEHSIEGIVVTNATGSIMQVNKAFSAITGYGADEALGQNPRILKSNRHPDTFYTEMWRQLIEHGQWSGEIWNRRKNGEIYPEWLTINAILDKQGKITNFVAIFHDITELKRQQEALEHQAQHDALTGLPNRVLLNDRLQEALKRMERSHNKLALMFLDLDNFKHINDGFGHTTGDSLLVELSRSLQGQLRNGDTLARQGGDEFLILLNDIDTIDDVSLVAMRLLGSLKQPFFHQDVEYFVTASIGITIAPADGNTAEILIKNADMAMYRAKSLGRNNFQFFTQDLDAKTRHRIALEAKLRRGLEQEEFELHYQPQVVCTTNTIIGAEALIRWRHGGELISPAEFIPLAEESGLILPLGAWVIRSAAAQAKHWQDAGYQLPVAVNLSSRQFVGQELTRLLKEVTLTTGLQTGRLYFEITESMLMENFIKAQSTLEELRQLGGKFYLDDFGTGYSSLAYLKRLPLDGLKIDRSFVRDLENDADSRAITAAIISLAKTMNLAVVAEGVETEKQLTILQQMSENLIIIQGFLASRPLPADQFTALLTDGRRLLPEG